MLNSREKSAILGDDSGHTRREAVKNRRHTDGVSCASLRLPRARNAVKPLRHSTAPAGVAPPTEPGPDVLTVYYYRQIQAPSSILIR